MEYRITKIKTKEDGFGSPVSTSLGDIVSRMRSETHAQTVDSIAHYVTTALIEQQEKGWSRFHLTDVDTLPYLIFTATFNDLLNSSVLHL